MALQDRFFAGGRWYYTVNIATCGLGAWIPFVHASSRLNDRSLYRYAATFGALAMLAMALVSLSPTDGQGDPEGPLATAGAVVALGIMVFASIKVTPIRRSIYLDPAPPAPKPVTDPALANALAARERRSEARRVVANDPMLARDLKIGRPDLPREYDDGGLVDLNNAPSSALVSACGLTEEAAGRIVAQRQSLPGGFSSIQEALVFSEQSDVDSRVLQERGVLLPR